MPHFEKMLYDNALLAIAYLEASQLTGRSDFRRVTREILDYVSREMTAPGGAFYSATDADSSDPKGESHEGWFFTWTPAELERALGADDARVVSAYYGVEAGGNFEGRTILHTSRSAVEVAGDLGIGESALRVILERARARLYEVRLERPKPSATTRSSWPGTG